MIRALKKNEDAIRKTIPEAGVATDAIMNIELNIYVSHRLIRVLFQGVLCA